MKVAPTGRIAKVYVKDIDGAPTQVTEYGSCN